MSPTRPLLDPGHVDAALRELPRRGCEAGDRLVLRAAASTRFAERDRLRRRGRARSRGDRTTTPTSRCATRSCASSCRPMTQAASRQLDLDLARHDLESSESGARHAVGSRIVYSQIASNKRRSVVFIGVFFLIWMGIGAIGGLLFIAFAHRNQYTRPARLSPTTAPQPIYVGMVICAILAQPRRPLLLDLGRARSCCASRAHVPADPVVTSRSTTSWSPSRSARGSPSPPST